MWKMIVFTAFLLWSGALFAQYYSVTDVMKMAPAMPANMVTATQKETSDFKARLDSVSAHIEELQKSYKHPYVCSADDWYKKTEVYYRDKEKISDFLSGRLPALNQVLALKVMDLETECWNKQQPLLAKLEQLTSKSNNPAQFQREVEMEKEIRRQIYALKVEFATKKVEAYKGFVKQFESEIGRLKPIIESVDETSVAQMMVPLIRSMALELGKYYIDSASGTFDYNVGPP